MYKVLNYEVYRGPDRPQDDGKYIGRTPIKEQALNAVKKAKEQGLVYYIKAWCSDGTMRYYS